MKKIILILATFLTVNIFGGLQVAECSTAIGKAPTSVSNPAQARLMARRAAQVMAMKDNGGQVPQVISENWNSNSGEYVIQY